MRNFILLIFTFVSFALAAQIQKGDRLLQLDYPAAVGLPGSAGGFFNLTYFPSYDFGVLGASASYGFALSNRFVLGARVSGYQSIGTGDQSGFGSQREVQINPYLRYYVINRTGLLIFGEVATGGTLAAGSGSNIGDDYRGGVGLSLPLASGVLVTPMLNYNMGDGRNSLTLNMHLEFVLGRNTREDAPVARFAKGSFMLGGQVANVAVLQDGFAGGFSLGGSYFLTDRLTIGSSLSVSGNSYGPDFFNFTSSDLRSRSFALGLDVGSRYYFVTGRRLVYFAEAGLGIVRNSSSFTGSGLDLKENNTNGTVSAGAGVQYFLRTNFALEAGLGYQHRLDDDANFSSLGLRLGAQFFL